MAEREPWWRLPVTIGPYTGPGSSGGGAPWYQGDFATVGPWTGPEGGGIAQLYKSFNKAITDAQRRSRGDQRLSKREKEAVKEQLSEQMIRDLMPGAEARPDLSGRPIELREPRVPSAATGVTIASPPPYAGRAPATGFTLYPPAEGYPGPATGQTISSGPDRTQGPPMSAMRPLEASPTIMVGGERDPMEPPLGTPIDVTGGIQSLFNDPRLEPKAVVPETLVDPRFTDPNLPKAATPLEEFITKDPRYETDPGIRSGPEVFNDIYRQMTPPVEYKNGRAMIRDEKGRLVPYTDPSTTTTDPESLVFNATKPVREAAAAVVDKAKAAGRDVVTALTPAEGVTLPADPRLFSATDEARPMLGPPIPPELAAPVQGPPMPYEMQPGLTVPSTEVLPAATEEKPVVAPAIAEPALVQLDPTKLPGVSTETSTGALTPADYINQMKQYFPDLDFENNPKQALADANARRDLERTKMLAQLTLAGGMVMGAGKSWEGLGKGFLGAAETYDKGFEKYQNALQDSADRWGEQNKARQAYDLARTTAGLDLYTKTMEQERADRREVMKAQNDRLWDIWKFTEETKRTDVKQSREDIYRKFQPLFKAVEPLPDPTLDPAEDERRTKERQRLTREYEKSIREGELLTHVPDTVDQ